MTKAQLETKYDIKCETLFYNGLQSAIPKKWIEIINSIDAVIENNEINENIELSIAVDKYIVKMNDIPWKQHYWAENNRKAQRSSSYFLNENQNLLMLVLTESISVC